MILPNKGEFKFNWGKKRTENQPVISQSWEKSILREKKVFTDLSVEQLDAFFELITDGLWEWNLESNHFNFNGRFLEILGYIPGNMPDNLKSWDQLIHPLDFKRVSNYFNVFIDSSDDELIIEFRVKCQNESWKWIQLKGRAIERNSDNQCIKIAGIQSDLSYQKVVEETLRENERKLMQQNEELTAVNDDLAEANRQMQEINRQLTIAKEKAIESDLLKSAFLANMSHEIRTPMNGIVGFANMLTDPGLPHDTVLQCVQIINSSSFQLLRIIDDIIDFSKIEAGQIDISPVKLHLTELLHEVVSLHEVNCPSCIKISTDLDPQCSNLEVILDGVRIRQVLNNLINNALKYTTKGTVTVGCQIEHNDLVFSISDTGKGIAPEHRTKIFDRFYQINSVETGKNSGTGLGLTISKALVELMGGDIWVNSSVGTGSTFYVSLPLVRVSLSDEIEADVKEMIDTEGWKSKVVLIAEDEEINFIFLKELISTFGCDVIWAGNGEEAVRTCLDKPEIDLVLMDLKMPIMNGYEASIQIRKFRPKLPIIAQTAYAMTDDRQKALDAGCNNYITKPIDKTSLVEMMSFFFKAQNAPASC